MTRFNGRVPLLWGDIVLTGRDALGLPADLDAHQVDDLTPARCGERMMLTAFMR